MGTYDSVRRNAVPQRAPALVDERDTADKAAVPPLRGAAESTFAGPLAADGAAVHSLADMALHEPDRAQARATSVASWVAQRRANNTGLPDRLKTSVEALSGVRLDDVKVHYNSSRPSRFRARAYARGAEVEVAPGEEHHLAHEAWHLVQQRQGRVRSTGQRNGLPINDTPALETEAEIMGARAARQAAVAEAPSGLGARAPAGACEAGCECSACSATAMPPRRPAAMPRVAVMQACSVDKNCPNADPCAVHGSFPPTVITSTEKGLQAIRIDDQGKEQNINIKEPPEHEKLQKLREAQGAADRKRYEAMSPKDLEAMHARLHKLAGDVETVGIEAGILPQKHAEKTAKLTGGFLAGQYRGAVKGQDEHVPTQGATHYFKTANQKGVGKDAEDKAALIDKINEAALRLYSALRSPTEHVRAPLDVKGGIRGQQHPSKKYGIEKIGGGGSSHSYSDRLRLEAQIKAHDDYSKFVQQGGGQPEWPVVATAFAGTGMTLSTMMLPASAPNTAGSRIYTKDQIAEQHRSREAAKKQTNILAEHLEISTVSGTQSIDAPWRQSFYPTSPYRVAVSQKQNQPLPSFSLGPAATSTMPTTSTSAMPPFSLAPPSTMMPVSKAQAGQFSFAPFVPSTSMGSKPASNNTSNSSSSFGQILTSQKKADTSPSNSISAMPPLTLPPSAKPNLFQPSKTSRSIMQPGPRSLFDVPPFVPSSTASKPTSSSSSSFGQKRMAVRSPQGQATTNSTFAFALSPSVSQAQVKNLKRPPPSSSLSSLPITNTSISMAKPTLTSSSASSMGQKLSTVQENPGASKKQKRMSNLTAPSSTSRFSNSFGGQPPKKASMPIPKNSPLMYNNSNDYRKYSATTINHSSGIYNNSSSIYSSYSNRSSSSYNNNNNNNNSSMISDDDDLEDSAD